MGHTQTPRYICGAGLLVMAEQIVDQFNIILGQSGGAGPSGFTKAMGLRGNGGKMGVNLWLCHLIIPVGAASSKISAKNSYRSASRRRR
jgi:hypothetical protein